MKSLSYLQISTYSYKFPDYIELLCFLNVWIYLVSVACLAQDLNYVSYKVFHIKGTRCNRKKKDIDRTEFHIKGVESDITGYDITESVLTSKLPCLNSPSLS